MAQGTVARKHLAGPTTTVRGHRRGRALAAGAGVLVVLAAGIAAVAWHDRTPAVPYTDPAAVARLTLCDDGRQVTKGGTADMPFVTAVVGGQQPSGAYATRTTATLYAYQPRAGLDPSEWSGLQLGATQPVAAPAPGVRVAAADTTLAQFVDAYPALDGGWVQLRLVLGAPGVPAETTTYAAADLHLRGTSWTQVDPGSAGCPAS